MEDLFADRYRIPSNRLSGYDYSLSGFYFITICTHNRVECLGDVMMDDNHEWSVALSDVGKITRDKLLKTTEIRPNVELDEWVIMPNHIHAIIVINNERDNSGIHRAFPGRDVARNVSTNPRAAHIDIKHASSDERKQWMSDISPAPSSLSAIIRSFKSAVTNQCHKQNLYFHWQSRYYDHIIRNERALNAVRHYIKTNPQMWNRDRNNAASILM